MSDENQKKETCPRCGAEFVCQPENITACQCYGVKLSEAVQAELSEKYARCLCRKCLEDLNQKTK